MVPYLVPIPGNLLFQLNRIIENPRDFIDLKTGRKDQTFAFEDDDDLDDIEDVESIVAENDEEKRSDEDVDTASVADKEIDVEDGEDIGDVIKNVIDETLNRAMANYENETEDITDNEPDFDIKKCDIVIIDSD